jgi:phosphate transport system protein
MQTYFEEELAKLRKRIIKMFVLVNNQLDKASQSLLNAEFENNEATAQNENHIDKLDIKIDKLCQRIFALAQPVATDLRFIMSSLRIGNEIERIGDIALDIIERSEALRPYGAIIEQYQVPVILAEVIQIGNKASEAYTNNNSELALEIAGKCKQVEELCKTIFNEIIARMTEKEQVIVVATDLILVVRNLERIANHFENVADSVVFIAEGKRIRHAGN